jgi:transposase
VSTKPVMDTGAIKRRRHRSWPEALKPEIVGASFAPGSSVSVVAWQYDVNVNQVFSWRERSRDARPVPSDPSAARLMPVVITAEQDGVAAPPSTVAEEIEIDVAGKYRSSEGRASDKTGCRVLFQPSDSSRRTAVRSAGERSSGDLAMALAIMVFHSRLVRIGSPRRLTGILTNFVISGFTGKSRYSTCLAVILPKPSNRPRRARET